MKLIKGFKNALNAIVSLTMCFAAPVIAVSNAGFQKANDGINYWVVGLASLSVATITLCIMWIGYKVLWDGKRIAEMTNVIIGGILIGGASGFAAWYVS